MRVVVKCAHGERTVELDDGREGFSPSLIREIAASVLLACPACEAQHSPVRLVSPFSVGGPPDLG